MPLRRPNHSTWTTRACHAPLLACILAYGGCGPAILSVDDAMISKKHEVRLTARLERASVLSLREDIEDTKVRFFIDGREVGDDDTDEEGGASKKCKLLPPLPQTFEARAVVDGVMLRTSGRIFRWDQDRVIIAVDIDGTISKTEYAELILEKEDDDSNPIKRSRKVLRRLAEDYQIVYVTARPRFLRDKTRQWLAEEKFPPGPVLTAPGLRQSARQVKYKRDLLGRLHEDWPTLLIGIGDKAGDAKAYGASKMLTLIVAKPEEASDDYGGHAIVLPDWKAVDRFFEANQDTLKDARKLREAIKGDRMLLRQVARYRDD